MTGAADANNGRLTLTAADKSRLEAVETIRARARSTSTLAMTVAGALIAGLVFGPGADSLSTWAYIMGGLSLLALAGAIALALFGANSDLPSADKPLEELVQTASALRTTIRRLLKPATILVTVGLGLIVVMGVIAAIPRLGQSTFGLPSLKHN